MSRYPGVRLHERTEAWVGGNVVASFMNMVYAWMCVGLALTAAVAWYVSTNEALLNAIFSSGLHIGLIVVQFALVFAIAWATQRINATVATVLFMVYAALLGLSLSPIFLMYTGSSIAGTFIICAGMFAATSIFGFVTKKDLTSLGGFLFMALIGLILASIVNIFMKSEMMYWVLTYAGVIIFVGLTAYDTQKLKEIAYATEGNPALANRLAISGALTLYLDFINLFLYLLRIFGKRD